MHPELHTHFYDSQSLPLLVWRFEEPHLAVSSSPSGGGLGLRSWIVNATVPTDYDRPDPESHLADLASGVGLTAGAGIGLLTAVDVSDHVTVADDGLVVCATVGIGNPEWAAVDRGSAVRRWDDRFEPVERVGTVNIVAFAPVRLAEGALVNAIATATEAKVQAFVDLGIDGSGTATDAVVVVCPADGDAEAYGGPRSRWGGRLARAVHQAVVAGAVADRRLDGRIVVPGTVTASGVALDG